MVEFEYTGFVFTHSWPSWDFDLKGLDCKELFTEVERETILEIEV